MWYHIRGTEYEIIPSLDSIRKAIENLDDFCIQEQATRGTHAYLS